jgi:hypothetical protein
MFEKIKRQLEKPETFFNTDAPYGSDKAYNQDINSSLYPLAQEYYHDLNPCFSFNLNSLPFFRKFPIVTFRDGAFSFASFMTQNYSQFNASEQIILIHKEIEHFVPSHLKSNFLSYQMTQSNRLKIQDAKRIVIIGILSDQVLEDENQIKEKLKILEHVSEEATIHLYLQSRKSPFQQFYLESTLIEPFKWDLFKRFKNQPVFLNSPSLLNLSCLGDAYVINLQSNRFMIADSYTDYLLASKGATIGEWNTTNEEEENRLLHPISLYHNIEISPIQKESVFPELMLKKKILNRNNLILDDHFWALTKQIF